MADDTPFAAEDAAPAKASRSWPLTILRWIGLSLLGLVLLFALFLIGLNSDAGRRFVVTGRPGARRAESIVTTASKAYDKAETAR